MINPTTSLTIEPGTYVVAVSGGVDSMVLLDLLRQRSDLELIVAHFDHGIRPDSAEDRKLVQEVAKRLGLQFEYAEGRLGPSASEATARQARYAFLQSVLDAHGAKALVTAHHQDDVLETAVLNMLRGTNRRGLSSLQSTDKIIRPLLAYSKIDILAYARAQGISWREDSTNASDAYARNYVRHQLITKLDPAARQKLVQLIERAGSTNSELDALLEKNLAALQGDGGLIRHDFIMLDHAAAKELMALWLRQAGIREYNKYMLERLVVGAKTANVGSKIDVTNGVTLHIFKHKLALDPSKR